MTQRDWHDCPWPGCTTPVVTGYCTTHHRLYMRDYRRRNRTVFAITADLAERLAGQPLSDEQLEAFAAAIPNSSVPDALSEILSSITQPTQEDDQ